MRLAARSGYDPTALADFLAHLEAGVEMHTGETNQATFFDSHPTTPDRVANINAEAARIDWTPGTPVAADRRDFLRRLDGLWYDQNPAQGVFRDQQFYQPDLGFTMTFPEEWTALNTPSYVGAYAEEQRAVVLVAIAGDEEPATYGARFEARLREEHRATPLESRAVEGGAWTRYYVTVEEEARGGETLAQLGERTGNRWTRPQ